MWHLHCEGQTCIQGCQINHLHTNFHCNPVAPRGDALLPVQVVDGSNLLSDRNRTEDKKLKKVKLTVFAMLASVCM